ncbi:MAG: orotidine 5'-phosphate decarboxylase / HUMPS family protein [Chitinophagaceae bacterium]
MHAHGGVDMLRAGVRGPARRAPADAGLEPTRGRWPSPCSPATPDAPPHILPKRVALAAEAGCGGIVCAAADLHEDAAQLRARGLTASCRASVSAGTAAHDQARAATPQRGRSTPAPTCSVIGRAVTAADDPVAAAAQLVRARITPTAAVAGRGSRDGVTLGASSPPGGARQAR